MYSEVKKVELSSMIYKTTFTTDRPPKQFNTSWEWQWSLLPRSVIQREN